MSKPRRIGEILQGRKMSEQLGFLSNYPDYPGARLRSSSIEAAAKVAPEQGRLKAECLKMLAIYGELTADEIADKMNPRKSVLAIRPRVAELAKALLIEDTGERRRNESGHAAIVWRIAK